MAAGVTSPGLSVLQELAWIRKHAALRADVPLLQWATVVAADPVITVRLDTDTTGIARQVSSNAVGVLYPDQRVRVEIQGTRIGILAAYDAARLAAEATQPTYSTEKITNIGPGWNISTTPMLYRWGPFRRIDGVLTYTLATKPGARRVLSLPIDDRPARVAFDASSQFYGGSAANAAEAGLFVYPDGGTYPGEIRIQGAGNVGSWSTATPHLMLSASWTVPYP